MGQSNYVSVHVDKIKHETEDKQASKAGSGGYPVTCPACSGSGGWYNPDTQKKRTCYRCNGAGRVQGGRGAAGAEEAG